MKRAPFRGLNAILFKEFITVLRDPMTLFFMLFPPLIEMIAFGYALDNDVKHMAMVMLNEDRTVESRQLPRSLCQYGNVSDCRRSAGTSNNWRARFARGTLMLDCKFRPTSPATCARDIRRRCKC